MKNLFPKIIFLIGVLSVLLPVIGGAETPDKDFDLLGEFLKLSEPPILQYGWSDGPNKELTEDLVRDYKRFGMNGIFTSTCSARGGRHFSSGYLPYLLGGKIRYKYRDNDGKVKTRWTSFGDLCDPENVKCVVDDLQQKIKTHGDTLFTIGGHYLAISGDEIDLQYGRTAFREVSSCRETAWRDYLRKHYKNTTPETDSNGDGRSYNKESLHKAETWDKITLPKFEERFDEPYIWDLYRDFHSRILYDFFEKVEKEADQRGIPLVFGVNSHASIMYPSGAGSGGGSYWYQAKSSPVFCQEGMTADWPTGCLGFAPLDRQSLQYRKPVLPYSWFWYGVGDRYGEGMAPPDMIERKFAHTFGHEIHALLYWTYVSLFQRHFPQTETIAFWHHWFRRHWDFLKRSHPPTAEVALLYPTHSANFYHRFQYPKHDYVWATQAFLDLHIPYTVLTEEEVEHYGVGDFKALFVMTAERVSKKTAQAIADYINRGGKVFADADSLAMDVGSKPLGLLESHFGLKLQRKYKTWFFSTILSREEEAWAEARKAGENALVPSRTPYGIEQVEFDPTTPQFLEMTIPGSVSKLATYNETVTAKVVSSGKVLATYHGEPAMVETDNTLWIGTRIGADICTLFPRQRLVKGGEPIPPLPYWDCEALSAYQRSAHVAVFARILEKAGVKAPVQVLRDGQHASNINVYIRTREKTGTVLIILVDQDLEIFGAPEMYQVKYPLLKRGFKAWDLTENRPLKWIEPGVVNVRVPEHRAKYLLMGLDKEIKKIAKRQADLVAMDLKPKPFRWGPRGGKNEPSLPTVQYGGRFTQAALPAGTVARLIVTVRNPTGKAKICEPMVLSGRDLLSFLSGTRVRGVRVKGYAAQWDDLDKNGFLSGKDEIAWQADIPEEKTVKFLLDLLENPTSQHSEKEFAATVKGLSAHVSLGGRTLFALNKRGEWSFGSVMLEGGKPMDMRDASGFVFGAGSWNQIAIKSLSPKDTVILADGPVRKTIHVRFASDEKNIESLTTFSIYRRQPANEVRIYAKTEHKVNKTFDLEETAGRTVQVIFGKSHIGSLCSLRESEKKPRASHWKDVRLIYEDAMGRLSSDGFYNNFGGWIATHHPSDSLLQVSLKRIKGILSAKDMLDEHDGVQVVSGRLARAAYDPKPKNPLRIVDTHIKAGTVWTLDTLICLRKGFDEEQCRATRREFAAPVNIVIEEVHIGR